jgi:WD40 repeat protein
VYRYDGTLLPNWPQVFDNIAGMKESSPVIADLNGDGSPDIVLGGQEGVLNAWDVNGNYIPGFPVKLRGYIRGTPVVADLDLDGDVEVAVASYDANVYVWDLEGDYSKDYAPWSSFHCNAHNNGWVEYSGVTATSQIAFAYQLDGGTVRLDWAVIDGHGSWSLYRRTQDTDFTLLRSEMRPDQTGLIHYQDVSAQEGLTYYYKIQADDDKDLFMETSEVKIPVSRARLYQNYPNPFNPSTNIAFTVPGTGESFTNTLLLVYDARGALVKTLVNRPVAGGRHVVEWKGDNDRGNDVASGVYFLRLSAGGVKDMKKMILLR